VFLLEASKIQVGKDVTQEDEATKTISFQHPVAARARLTSAPRCTSTGSACRRRPPPCHAYTQPMLQGDENCTEISASLA